MKRFKLKVCKNAYLFFTISIIVISIGMAALLINGLNFGIDFKGGTIIQIELNTTFKTNDIKEITDKYDNSCEITSAGADNTQVVISSKIDFNDSQKISMLNDFKAKYNEPTLLSFDKVSATFGKDLQNQALIASLVTIFSIMIYVSIRFEFLFGVAALVSLAHDLLVVIGVYAVLKIPVNSSFIAAVLTILGYSINDTIVIFDRIRENRRKYGKYDYLNLIDDSVNQTMNRTINTTFTVLLAVSVLYFFGVKAIQEILLPMIIGFLSGVYSTIFIASTLWYVIKDKQASKIQAKLKTR